MFRVIIQIGKRQRAPTERVMGPIELDDDNENERTLEAALSIVIHGRSITAVSVAVARDVAKSFEKYGFKREIELCKYQLHTELFLQRDPWDVFLRAAYFSDHDLCGRAIAQAGSSTRPRPRSAIKGGSFGETLPTGHLFDLRTAPRQALDLLPLDCQWALMRASLKAGPSDGTPGKFDSKAFGDEYVRLMRLRGESPEPFDQY